MNTKFQIKSLDVAIFLHRETSFLKDAIGNAICIA